MKDELLQPFPARFASPTGDARIHIIGFRPNVLPAVAHQLVNLLPFDDTSRIPYLVIDSDQQANFAGSKSLPGIRPPNSGKQPYSDNKVLPIIP